MKKFCHSCRKTNYDKGFTLIEVVIAISVTVIVLLALSGQLSTIINYQNSLAKKTEGTIIGAAGIRFVSLVESADLSYAFSHVPISVKCSSENSPCVRVLNTKTSQLHSLTGSIPIYPIPQSVEFFRDDNAEIKSNISIIQSGELNNKPIYYSTTTPFDGSKLNDGIEYYVTWPLIDEKSAPFSMLVRQQESVYFKFDERLATSNPTDAFALFEAQDTAPTGSQVQDLVGQLMILYNGHATKQYVIKRVDSVVSCAENTQTCISHIKSLSDKVIIGPKHFMFRFDSIDKSQLTSYVADINELASTPIGEWPGSGDFYFFPTNKVTLTQLGNTDLEEPFDVKKWSHFYHVNSLAGDVLALPAKLVSYYYKKKSDDTYSLVSREFNFKNPKNEIVEIESIKGSVHFARKLGTSTIKLMIFGEAL